MTKYISKEVARRIIDSERSKEQMLRMLEQTPTADVRKNAHGEWIKMDKRGKNVQCPKCGNTLDLRGVNAGRGDANYCSNCGAKMSTQSNVFPTH